MHTKVMEMPSEERPYEKALRYGVEVLSDAELLAVVIRCGTGEKNSVELAREIISSCEEREGIAALNALDLSELMRIKGIGRVKAVQLKALCEFSKRLWRTERLRGDKFSRPETAAMYFMEEMRRLSVEEVRILFLDNACRKIREELLSRGTVNASLVSTREVLLKALKCGAVKMIMVHNHPSGDPTPSKEDILITDKLINAGALIDIRLEDSIIIGDGKYISLRQNRIVEFV